MWFVSDSPAGPWQLAREVPDAIYQIPPSSPVYNATYVRVYETEPDAVWYGYTMGYLYGFLAWGTYVYGTGWAYRPYFYNWPGYAYPIYYPPPGTWGLGAYYNPIRGAYGRYGYAYGPYRGIAGGADLERGDRHLCTSRRRLGPRGTAGSSPPTIRAPTGRDMSQADATSMAPGRPPGSPAAPNGRAPRRARTPPAARVAMEHLLGPGLRARGAPRRLYAGRDGNVYRNTGNGWQSSTAAGRMWRSGTGQPHERGEEPPT